MPFLIKQQPDAFVYSDANRAIGYEDYIRQQQELEMRARQQAAELAQRDQQMALQRDRLVADQQPAAAPVVGRRGPIIFPGVGRDQNGLQNRVLQFISQQAGQQLDFGRDAALLNQRGQQAQALQANQIEFQRQREDDLLAREQLGQQSQLQRERHAQLVRRLDAEWQAVLEHRHELSDSEFQDVQNQIVAKYQALGEPPPVKFPGSQHQSEGEKRLQEYKQLYPDMAWVLGKDGEPELARGTKPEMSQKYRDQQQQHEIEKAVRVEEAKTRVQSQAAEIKEKAEAAKRQADNLASYGSELAKASIAARKDFNVESTDEIGNKKKSFDQAGYEEHMKQTEAILAAGYQVPQAARQLGGVKPAPTSNGPVQVTTQQEWESLPSGTQYIAPDGSTRIKQ